LSGISSQWLSNILLFLIWLLLIVAAARPQWVGDPIALSTSGRDLLIAVDISDSMEQTDMILNGENISRLQAVKQVVTDFIERRKGDRIGLVLFGTHAYLQTPLTFDTETVAKFLDEAQLGFAGPKTAIGDAIGLSVKRLKELNNDNRVLILLTDGANTSGEVEPLQAAVLAKQTGIKTYTIGIGADEMIIRSFFGPRRINPSAQLDEKTLINIAEATGGRYFRARETEQLEIIYQELDQLEPISQDQEWLRPTQSLFVWPLLSAIVLSFVLILQHISFSYLLLSRKK
jgi:Ca-activated chloride channel family protein